MLVAVSGGADSTALLIGLHRIVRELGLTLRAAHLHHRLRGAEADRDLDFVRALCARLEIPLDAARWNTRARMRRRGLSGQAGLRILRREFLLGAARRWNAIAIATAHHADDQLETVLMRLARGTGLRGWGGMSPRRGIWIKPMLEIPRAEIEADLRRAGEEWREDSSNRSHDYARNRIRHRVIPELIRALEPECGSDRGPSDDPARARASLARRVGLGAAALREAGHFLDLRARSILSTSARIQAGHIRLEASALRRRPAVLRHAVLRSAWKRANRGGSGLMGKHLGALDHLIEGSRGAGPVALPDGFEAVRDRGHIRLALAVPALVPAPTRLPVPGQAEWCGRFVQSRWTSGRGALEKWFEKEGDEEYFAADGIRGNVELRLAREDETFVPFGRRRPVPLGRFLKNQGVTRDHRNHLEVLADAGGILWVIGIRRSARAPVTDRTRRVLWVHAERHD